MKLGFGFVLLLSLAAAATPLPPGPGAELVYQRCSGCHALTTVLAARGSDAAEWEAVVRRMEGYGMALESGERRELLNYLVSRLGPAASDVGPTGSGPAPQGEALYARYCAGCHENGTAAPPLLQRQDLRDHPEYVAQVVFFGVAGELRVGGSSYRSAMEPLPFLNDAQVAAIVRFLTEARFTPENAARERARGWTPSLVRLFRPSP